MTPDLSTPSRHKLHEDIFAMLIGTMLVSLGIVFYAQVTLTTGTDNPNAAVCRFFVDRAVPQSADGYERIVYMFSGQDPDAVAEARVAWKALKANNVLTYWQQEADGRWVKKA